ncbi:MAG: fumarylacetoacetate hydrolase family protein [Sutterella sp.]|nr:fumarylacetoacetate hydrolase family protein [Sutterella sp.]
MPFVFAPPQQAVVPVQDERYEFFPIHRVYGIGKNYAEPGTVPSGTPFYFLKPADAVVPVADNETAVIPVPPGTNEMKHEIELVAALGRGGRNLTLEQAAEAVWGWCVGIDFTLGDQRLDGGANDFMRGKAFDRSAPVSHIRPAYRTPMPAPADLWLYVNNQKRQSGTTANLIVKPLEVIVEISKFWELRPGDLIFTGTPGGASRVVPGDRLEGGVNGVGTIRVEIV